MAEYIEREELVRQIICNMAEFIGAPDDVLKHDEQCNYAIFCVESAPAADVAPVVHGRWEDSIDEWFETDVYTCSKCRESYVLVEGTPKENLWHYCPNCGAKMDGGADDEM